jgi:hypothetical protein
MQATKACRRVDLKLRVLELALGNGERSASRPGRFNPRERALRMPMLEMWVGLEPVWTP